MSVDETGRLLYSLAGLAALLAFWTAALAIKGSARHQSAGRICLQALLCVFALAVPLAIGEIAAGKPDTLLFHGFLLSMSGVASWLMWFSIRLRPYPRQLSGTTYWTLAIWLVFAGGSVFALAYSYGSAAPMLLAVLGVGFGLNMMRLALPPAAGRRTWLTQHMNGAMLNFIVMHDAFVTLGVGTFVPELREGIPRAAVAATIIMLGLLLRLWFGRQNAAITRAPLDVDRSLTARIRAHD